MKEYFDQKEGAKEEPAAPVGKGRSSKNKNKSKQKDTAKSQ